MKLLLDTHHLVWALEDSKALKPAIRSLIADPENVIFASVASLWEVAIKVSLGKLHFAGKSVTELAQFLEKSGTAVLPVSVAHLAEVERLPWHHRDPFDRLIIAQARVENLRMVSVDAVIRQYLPDVLS
jgi:PIN domain nuclease of toxin-antitoxin system